MTDIIYEGDCINVPKGASVLDALLDHGHMIPNNCRAGVCQSCLMQVEEGEAPEPAQIGLKDTLKAQGYFLACCCKQDMPVKIRLPAAATVRIAATVIDSDQPVTDVLRLRLRPESDFDYYAGQYVTIWNSQQVGRTYSLASVAGLDDFLEFHIARITNGRFSNWLFDGLKHGDSLQLQPAAGNCFYVPDKPRQKMVLAGTGTGLAPLVGVARDALYRGHKGEIHLIHGAGRANGLYLHEELQLMAKAHENFYYHASVLDDEPLPGNASNESIESLLTSVVPDPGDWKVYLCGAPELVNSLKKKMFLSGASMSNIYSDPFLSAADGSTAA